MCLKGDRKQAGFIDGTDELEDVLEMVEDCQTILVSWRKKGEDDSSWRCCHSCIERFYSGRTFTCVILGM